MSEPPRRDFLGEYRGLAERTRVFRTAEGLEVDTSDHYEIRRRRVFYDEVLLVTLHKGLSGGLYPLVFVLLALSMAVVIPIVGTEGASAWILGGWTAFFLVAAVASFFIPAWTVTVFGKRTRTRVRFRFRQTRARQVYAEICQAAAAAQRQLAERQRAQAPVAQQPSALRPLDPLGDDRGDIGAHPVE